MAVDYVTGKKNSVRAKVEKAMWYEKKVNEYAAKAQALREETKADQKVISGIESLEADRKELVGKIDSFKTRIAQPMSNGLTIDSIFEKIKEHESEIEEIDTKIRALYYGK